VNGPERSDIFSLGVGYVRSWDRICPNSRPPDSDIMLEDLLTSLNIQSSDIEELMRLFYQVSTRTSKSKETKTVGLLLNRSGAFEPLISKTKRKKAYQAQRQKRKSDLVKFSK
jgi:hypothetical protein